MRTSEVFRETRETSINLWLDLDGTGNSSIDTGVGFMDHMLELFSKHSRFDLAVTCVGDYDVDDHHSVEDIGIALGKAFAEALGDKRGIWRYGDTTLAMDEALILTSVDISGRAYLGYEVEIPTQKVGTFDTELVEEFLIAFVRNAGLTLHVVKLSGKNTHHIIEGIFKSLARTLRRAVSIDPEFADDIPSTKGMLEGSVESGTQTKEEPKKAEPAKKGRKKASAKPLAKEAEEPKDLPEPEPEPEEYPELEDLPEPEPEPAEYSGPEDFEEPEAEPEEYTGPEEEDYPPSEEETGEAQEAEEYDEADDFVEEYGDLSAEEEEMILRELEELERAEEETFDGAPYEEDEFDLESMVEDPAEPTRGFRFDTSFYDDGYDPDVDDIDKLAESMARSSLKSERSAGLGLDGDSGIGSESKGLDDDYGRGLAKGYTEIINDN